MNGKFNFVNVFSLLGLSFIIFIGFFGLVPELLSANSDIEVAMGVITALVIVSFVSMMVYRIFFKDPPE